MPSFDYEMANSLVCLAPLEEQHRESLRVAAADQTIWAHLPAKGFGSGFDVWFDQISAENQSGDRFSYAVRDLNEQAFVGHTSFCDVAPSHRRLEIGWTWLNPRVQGRGVNKAAKLLMLDYAFDHGIRRVQFKTHAGNDRSIYALQALGAHYEGHFRSHMVDQDGGRRDSTFFSIIDTDWSELRPRLIERIARAASNFRRAEELESRLEARQAHLD